MQKKIRLKLEAQIISLRDDFKMKFVDIARQLKITDTMAYAIYFTAKKPPPRIQDKAKLVELREVDKLTFKEIAKHFNCSYVLAYNTYESIRIGAER